MQQYLATFHTHLSAMLSCQALQSEGLTARMTPVPRALSSSCGTCVRYAADGDQHRLLDQDLEAVYTDDDGIYTLVYQSETV